MKQTCNQIFSPASPLKIWITDMFNRIFYLLFIYFFQNKVLLLYPGHIEKQALYLIHLFLMFTAVWNMEKCHLVIRKIIYIPHSAAKIESRYSQPPPPSPKARRHALRQSWMTNYIQSVPQTSARVLRGNNRLTLVIFSRLYAKQKIEGSVAARITLAFVYLYPKSEILQAAFLKCFSVYDA